MSEETLVRELERRAGDVQPRHLRFEDVRATAYRIRRRRRLTACGAAAAVVAAVLVVPGLVVGSPDGGPEPAPPAPTITPGQTVPFDLDAPQGDPPGVLYQRADPPVAIDADGEHDLPEGTYQVTPYDDGYLAMASTEKGQHATRTELYRLSSDFGVAEDKGEVVPMLAVTPGGGRVAWTEVAPGHTGTVVVDDGTDVQRVTLPTGQVGYPYAFTADGVVYHRQTKQEDLGFWELTADGESHEVQGLEHVWDASASSNLLVGVTRFPDSGLPCVGAVRDDVRLWQRCGYTLEELSPDGSMVFGYPDRPTPGHAQLTVLDAETGDPVVAFDGSQQAQVVGQPAWEDDGHVLAVVQQGGRQAVLRLGLDGTVERATDAVQTGSEPVLWFLGGRPFE